MTQRFGVLAVMSIIDKDEQVAMESVKCHGAKEQYIDVEEEVL